LEGVARWLKGQRVERVTIEIVTSVYGPGQMVRAARASEIAKTQRIGGMLLGYLLAEGFDVSTVVESTWHAAAVPGKRTKRARVGGLLPALEEGFGGTWPEQSNEHVRDAGGMLLAATKPTTKKKATPVPKAKGPHKSHAKRATARQAARAAIGCNCKGRSRHAATCPARLKAS
jgi:hypothetical protein